jgi:peptide deformylase
MTLEILIYPHPVLKSRADEILAVDEEIKKLVAEMAETMYENNGVGLAAPQVGKSMRLIVYDLSGPEKREALSALVNPKILTREGEIESDEGCLSVPGIRGDIARAEFIKVSGLALDGRVTTFEAEGLLAICIQHEIDHLEGTLILDHFSRLKRGLYETKVKKWKKRKGDSPK